jgi:TRAP-type uncharacterized transport system substrate-binding protein
MSWAASWAASSWWPLRGALRRLPGRWLCAVIGVCAAVAAASEAAAGPGDIGIVVTNATYDDSRFPGVKYAEHDGDAMASAMKDVFGVDQRKIQRGRNLTKGQFESWFGRKEEPERGLVWQQVERANDPKARLIVYYSGHGVPAHPTPRGASGETGLLGKDADFLAPELLVYALPTLRDNLKAIKKRLLPEGQVILILESCFSGQSGDHKSLRQDASGIPVSWIDLPGGEIIELDAAKDKEDAAWDDYAKHGMFTHQLLWGLYGRADSREDGGDGDGKVTLRELKAFVEKGLQYKGGRQTAVFSGPDDTVLTAAKPWPRRPGMADIETQERFDCDKMLRAPARGNSTREQLIADAKEYPVKCVWCGSVCKAATLSLLTDLLDKQQDREICRAVQTRLDAFTDPEDLLSLAATSQCPNLQEEVLKKTWSVLKVKGNAEQIRQFRVLAGTLQKEVDVWLGAHEQPAMALARRPEPPAPLPPVPDTPPPELLGRTKDVMAMIKRVQDKIERDGSPDATYKAINSRAKEFTNGDLYPFIVDFDGVEHANGGKTPGVIEQHVIDLRDQNGQYIISDLIDRARNLGKGWYGYVWLNPKTNVVEDKWTYVERLTGKDALVGVGFYKNLPPPRESIGVISGSPDGTYLYVANDMARVLNDKLRVLPIVGTGAARNIIDVRYVEGIHIGLTQSGILNHLRSNNKLMEQSENKIVYIAKLFNEEVHLIARNDIASIDQLRGKTVNIDAEGSGTSYTMREIFRALKIKVDKEVHISQTEAIEKIRNGEIDATALIAGKPVRSMSWLTPADGLHLLAVPFSQSLAADYQTASLTHVDYPGLIPEGSPVETVTGSAVLFTFNWKTGGDRYKQIEKFIDAFFSNIDDFKKPPYHPKWREVNPAATLRGWTRFEAAQNWLDRHGATEQPKPANGGGPSPSRASQRH